MSQDDHLIVLRDPSRNFVERLRAGSRLDLELWDKRDDPPNLTREEFLKVLPHIPLKVQVKWAPRESPNGKYGLTGEDQVFSFDFEVVHGRHVFGFYIKGFFFEKHDLKGVEIQSFRRTKKFKRGLRLVT